MNLYFRAGYSWQDYATLYCGVLRACWHREHPYVCYRNPLWVDKLQKCALSSGRWWLDCNPILPQLDPLAEYMHSFSVDGRPETLLL